MNAHKFVAEKGIDEAKRVLCGAPDFPVFGYCVLTGSYIFERKYANAYYHNETNSWSEDYALELIILKELNHLFESVELIRKLGGLIAAKSALAVLEFETGAYPEQLRQAIADVELIEQALAGEKHE